MAEVQPPRVLQFDTPLEFTTTKICALGFGMRWAARQKATLAMLEYAGDTPISRPTSALTWERLDGHKTRSNGRLGTELGKMFKAVAKQYRSGAVDISDPVINLNITEPPSTTIDIKPTPKTGNWNAPIDESNWLVSMDVTTSVKKRMRGIVPFSVYLDMRGKKPVLYVKARLLEEHPHTVSVVALPMDRIQLTNHACWTFLTWKCSGKTLVEEVQAATDAALADALGTTLTEGWPGDVFYSKEAYGTLPKGTQVLKDADLFKWPVTDPAGRFLVRNVIAAVIKWSGDNDRLTREGSLLSTHSAKQIEWRRKQGAPGNRLRIYEQFLHMTAGGTDYAFDLTSYRMFECTGDTPGQWSQPSQTLAEIAPTVTRVWCDGIEGDIADSFDGYCELVGLPTA